MKRLLLMFFMTLNCVFAAASVDDSSTHVLLGLNGGAGVGVYRDEGLSPLLYRGLEIHPSISVEVRQPLWRYEALVSIDGGAYGFTLSPTGFHAFGGQVSVAFNALQQVYSAGCWRLWAGVGIDDLFDIRCNPQFENASVGASNFARVNVLARAEAQMRGWLAWGQLGFTPVALLYRPGFAYMPNYERNISNFVDCFFDQYHLYCAAATGISSQLGVTRQLANGNEFGLSYRWHHITSRSTPDGVSAPYRFDQSSHALMVHFLFNIQ